MLNHVSRRIVANQIGIPPVGGEQALHPVGRGAASLLRQLPAVLALHRTQQSSKIVQNPPPGLLPPEPPRDAPVYLINAVCPPAHFRHFIPMTCHSLTSSTLNCPDSTRS